MCRGHVKEERGVFPTGFIKTEDSINIMYFYGIFFKQGKVWGKFLYKNEWIKENIGQMYSKANLEMEKN